MKRMHVHVAADNVADSIRFYSVLVAAEPTVRKSDYAKWMLDDPRVNFAISQRGADAGIEHLGIQVETADELHEVYARLQHAGCCTPQTLNGECCPPKGDRAADAPCCGTSQTISA